MNLTRLKQLIVYIILSLIFYQNSIAQDTTKVYFNYYELKNISKYLIELKYIREEIKIKDHTITIQDSLIQNLNNKINLSENINNQLQNKIYLYESYLEDIKNSWYDNFIFGFISGIVFYYLLNLIR